MTSLADAVRDLATRFSGQLLRPGEPVYDEARRVHNGLIDRRPALIARCPEASAWSIEDADAWWGRHERGQPPTLQSARSSSDHAVTIDHSR